MTLVARITPIWKKQKLFVALLLLAFAAYFFYDGKIRWPRQNEHYAVWRSAKTEGREEAWNEYARSRGLALDFWTNHARKKEWRDDRLPPQAWTQAQLTGQIVIGTILGVLALVMLVYWKQQIGRTLRLDDDAVTSPAGTRVPLTALTGLGLKKWEAKGYATVRYEIDGRKGEFLIDDYKFEPEPTRKIVDELKAHLTARGGGKRPSSIT